MQPSKKIKKKKRIGFVASGGAAKAACFHMGVALALERKGFCFRKGMKADGVVASHTGRDIDVLVGSSAGSVVGSLLLSGHPIDEIYQAFLGKRSDPFPPLSYLQMLHPNWRDTLTQFWNRIPKSLAIRGRSFEALGQALLCANGLYTTDKIEQYLRQHVLKSQRFGDYAAELYIVTTLLDQPGRAIMGPKKLYETDQTTYYTGVDIAHAAAASMSLPPIFKPYLIRNGNESFYCFDGEIRQTLSTHVAKDAGCDLIIASYTHQPYHYKEQVGSLIDYGMPAILVQAIYQLIEAKILKAKKVHEMKEMVLDTVVEFFNDEGLPKELKDKLVSKLEEKMSFNPDLDYVFIHPSTHDETLFFEDHFNISTKKMEHLAEQGFRAAIRVLKDYEFTFREPVPEGRVVGI